MIEKIKCRCPKCQREMDAPRLSGDPQEAFLVEIICPTCDEGDRDEPMYFDKDNTHIVRDYASQSTAGHTSIITKETTFRSRPLVNMTDDMVRVELIMSRNDWHRIKRAIKAVVS